jgi:drug/metabolite transporter (DMT)-like permease
MYFLILSIICNAAIYLIFKWFEKLNVQVFPAIVVNYLTALSIGLWMVPDLRLAITSASTFPIWTMGGLAIGIVFIIVFYLIAITAQKAGVSVTTIASKMSLAFAALLFVWSDDNEHLSGLKILAIILALAGVIFSSVKQGEKGIKWNVMLFPFLILIGSTLIDFGLAYFSSFPKNENELTLYSCLSFAMAGACGLVIYLYRLFAGKMPFRSKDLIAGLGLGIVNYGSIYFLIKGYDAAILPKSSMLPINNLSIVLVGSLGAMLFFREKLTRINWVGLLLAIVAIALIAFES